MIWLIVVCSIPLLVFVVERFYANYRRIKENYAFLVERNNYLQQFEKYKTVDDACIEATRILNEAHTKANNILSTANAKALTANSHAKKIILDAQLKAQEIAGDALDARDNAKLYEQTARAMKNTILGYGSDYLIPSRTLLDDLADTYGYSQASQDYKSIRSQIRNIIKNN